MSVIHFRRMGRLFDPADEPSPSRGETITRRIPDDESGIRFEIGRMVRYVKDFRAHPDVFRLARTVVSLCAAKDRRCEMNALFLWTKSHFRYVNDPLGGEVIMTPPAQIAEIETPPEAIAAILGPELLAQMRGFGVAGSVLALPNRIQCRGCFDAGISGARHGGRTSEDCDGGAVFLSTMLAAVGIVPRFRFGGNLEADGRTPNWHHVWVQGLGDDGEWADMDITEDKATLGWSYPHFLAYGHVDIFNGA